MKSNRNVIFFWNFIIYYLNMNLLLLEEIYIYFVYNFFLKSIRSRPEGAIWRFKRHDIKHSKHFCCIRNLQLFKILILQNVHKYLNRPHENKGNVSSIFTVIKRECILRLKLQIFAILERLRFYPKRLYLVNILRSECLNSRNICARNV